MNVWVSVENSLLVPYQTNLLSRGERSSEITFVSTTRQRIEPIGGNDKVDLAKLFKRTYRPIEFQDRSDRLSSLLKKLQ